MSRTPGQQLPPPLEPFRDELRAMAEREIAAEQRASRPARRRRWRAGGLALLVGGAVAVGATATQLISTGDPVEPGSNIPRGVKLGKLRVGIAATAPDPAFDRPWAIGIVDRPGGQECAVVGQLRGTSLGVVEGGVFRRYGARTALVCGTRKRSGLSFVDIHPFRETTPKRYVVYGRASQDIVSVRISVDDQVARAPVSPDGAFLAVFDARPHLSYRAVGYDARGRPIG